MIVTYGRNLLFPADSKSYTTPRRISGAVGAATKCTFYPLFTTSQGGGISAEVHLLVPVDAVPTAMDAIWQLPGVNATRVTVSQDFAVGPKDNGAVGPVTDCAAASGNFAD